MVIESSVYLDQIYIPLVESLLTRFCAREKVQTTRCPKEQNAQQEKQDSHLLCEGIIEITGELCGCDSDGCFCFSAGTFIESLFSLSPINLQRDRERERK